MNKSYSESVTQLGYEHIKIQIPEMFFECISALHLPKYTKKNRFAIVFCMGDKKDHIDIELKKKELLLRLEAVQSYLLAKEKVAKFLKLSGSKPRKGAYE